MQNEIYEMSNIMSGAKIEGKEFYYVCEGCSIIFDWHSDTVLFALVHFNKTGHKDGRLSVRDIEETDEEN